MYNPRGYANQDPAGTRRKRCDKFRRMCRQFSPMIVVQHPHSTDSPNIWRTAWAGLRDDLPTVQCWASGIYYKKKARGKFAMSSAARAPRGGPGHRRRGIVRPITSGGCDAMTRVTPYADRPRDHRASTGATHLPYPCFDGAASVIEAEAGLRSLRRRGSCRFNGAASVIEAEEQRGHQGCGARSRASTGPPRAIEAEGSGHVGDCSAECLHGAASVIEAEAGCRAVSVRPTAS